ncbi:hypothetical protein EX30DRAFT_359787 [Ascodesmis nigricans]|uniref:STAS domain-containing protein n=1 Tax=Ascodesmis nigricans TaxID=341454 RepID=A0A4S2MRJ6_9PEZI|nr:hypothetical protein EX30DRAFT_359787 [Ascodesmis nigricans]
MSAASSPGERAPLLTPQSHDNNGTFSPPRSPNPPPHKPTWLSRATTTTRLATTLGVERPWLMYLSYYIPVLSWSRSYRLSYLPGDITAGITVASMYIPMALSLSANLAHLPPIHGLYGFAIQPVVYALLGSSPTMVVGPEAAGSLLMGAAIRGVRGPAFDDGEGDGESERLAGVITFLTGLFALVAGGMRLGFLDSVMSKPLLRGFISGVGFVILVDQLLPELGLSHLASEAKITRASTLTKLLWLSHNLQHTHLLTLLISLTTLSTILLLRFLHPRFPALRYLPDRLLLVLLSLLLTRHFSWDQSGVEILGAVSTPGGKPFRVISPISISHLTHVKAATSSAFLISVLGFFESVIAAKALSSSSSSSTTTSSTTVSTNRELIALGTSNLLGGCFMALPSFGGYGRSKINLSTGARTQVSSLVLALCTILCIYFLLPAFYYLPKAVLSAMISAVAVALLEEAPGDVGFFWGIGARGELGVMAAVFAATVVWSLEMGIALGVGVSLIQVLRAAATARIQIVQRDVEAAKWQAVVASSSPDSSSPGSDDEGEGDGGSGSITNNDTAAAGVGNVETADDAEDPQTLILTLSSPLSFANANDLAHRLWRLERYGDLHSHPSLPPRSSLRERHSPSSPLHHSRGPSPTPAREGGSRELTPPPLPPRTRTIIFDLTPVPHIDGTASLLIRDMVRGYRDRGVRVLFVGAREKVWRRLVRAGVVGEGEVGRERFDDVESAVRAAEGC